MKLLLLAVTLIFICGASRANAPDPRFAMSGWKSFEKMEEVGATWFLNWGRSLNKNLVNNDHPYLRMYWRTKAGEFTDEQIQDWAKQAREMHGPDAEIYWTASNEPNEKIQANQTPAEFAAGYYQYHKNLKIGDPKCKVLGPGILNWTFKSYSVWQEGGKWYRELRELWAKDPVYSAYSMSVQGNPYPPMDAFNMHTYDLLGLQGTPPQGPPTWQYLRDEALACYNDLQTWPETKDLKIWNTEYSLLRGRHITDGADTLGGIALWFKEQPWMEKWFFFIIAITDDAWNQTILLDKEGNINSLGKAHHALSTMGDAEVYNMPFNAPYSIGSRYTRAGCEYTERIDERYFIGINFIMQKDESYKAGDMRGRTYTMHRPIKRVTFNYRMTCDPALYQLELDIPGTAALWKSGDQTLDQWADIDLSQHNTKQISFGLYCIEDNQYTGETGSAGVQINNITFWFDTP